MNKFLLSLIAISLSMGLFAQNNSVVIKSKKTGAVLNGTKHRIYGDGANFVIKEEFYAVMSKQDSMQVAIRRTEIEYIPGTSDYFCWYLCYNPVAAGTLKDWHAEDSLWMYQDSVITNFSVYLMPNSTIDTACYRYTFYPADNPSDSAWMDVVFDIVTVGINEEEKINISMYPNPVSEMLNIELPRELNDEMISMELYDMNGKAVIRRKLNTGNNRIEIGSQFNNGSYLIRISDGSTVYKKEFIQISK